MSKKLVAVIDIGSINARLKIFEIGAKGKPKEVESCSRFISLGAQGYTSGMIQPAQVTELCTCLNMFDVKCKEYHVSKVFCMATSAFREAGNRDVVLDQIKVRTGFDINVLDNSIERHYHNTAIKETMPDFVELIKSGTMILDIGAGSMQATVYDNSEFVFSQNTVLGSLRVSDLLSDIINRTTHYEDVLEEFISQDLNDYHNVEPKGIVYKSLIAFGGEIGFLKTLSGKDRNSNTVMTKQEFMNVYEYLLKTRASDLTLNNSIPASVAPLLLPSALIIRNMLEYTGLDMIYLPTASLSDGVIYNYCFNEMNLKPTIKTENDLICAARNIAKRYKVDKKHIEFVERMSLEIFDASKSISGLNDRHRLYLRLASILHEVGKFVDAKNHNNASYALIRYTDLIGLSNDELNIIGLVVRLYPTEDPYSDNYYSSLPSDKKVVISKLTSMLRLADALDASHKQKVKGCSAQLMHSVLTVSCDVTSDMSFEEWSFEHRALIFEEVLGITPHLKLKRRL